jgi:peptide/nickel transport system substrate-binding protein
MIFKNKKTILVVALVLALAMFTTACVSGGQNSGEAKEDLVVAQGSDAKTLDPQKTNDNPSSRVMKQIYNTLIVQTEEMELVPGLAEWEVVDEKTYSFKLVEGVKFHNGEELKASDVKFTFDRILDPATKSPASFLVSGIDKVEVIGEYEFVITTKEPFAPFLAHLSHTATSIINEKAVMAAGEDYGTKPVGTGPFKLSSWKTGDSIVLERFEEYYLGAAKLKTITFRNITENSNRTIGLETGTIDIAYDIAPDDIKLVESHKDLKLNRKQSLATGYIGFNTNKAPFDKVEVRQAINHAVNVDSIITTVLKGLGRKATGPIGPDVFASNSGLNGYEYNVEKAKQLLAEAGYEKGFEATIWTNDNPTRVKIAEIVQNQLKQIGITLKIESLEFGAYLDATAAGNHDMFILAWGTVTGDPDYGLYSLFHSTQFGSAGNRTFYANDRVDELLDMGRTTLDSQVRTDAYMEIQEIIAEEAPWIFLNITEYADGLRKNIQGFKQHPNGTHNLYPVYFGK